MSELPAAPGWYDDPQDPTLLRYYDGILWTAHTTTKVSPTAAQSTIGHAHEVQSAASHAPVHGTHQGAPPLAGWATGPYAGTQSGILPSGVRLAAWWQRLLARIIDVIITSIIALVVSTPWLGPLLTAFGDYLDASVTAAEAGTDPPSMIAFQTEIAGLMTPITIATLLVGLAYETLFLTWKGATPGKMMLGMQVRRSDGTTPIQLVGALRRQVIQVGTSMLAFVPVVGLLGSVLSLVDSIWLLFDPRRQCLHDKVADTVVVLKDR